MATMGSRPERVVGHTGTEIRAQTPTGGSSREASAMGETLTVRRRVGDEGFLDRKTLSGGKKPYSVNTRVH